MDDAQKAAFAGSLKKALAKLPAGEEERGLQKLSTDERAYLISLEKLYEELKKAKEQDFDAHLADGLVWCKLMNKRLDAVVSATSTPTGEQSGGIQEGMGNEDENVDWDMIMPRLIPGAVDKNALPGLIQRIKQHRNSGHKGRAIDRDLTKATEHAKTAKDRWQEMQKAAHHAVKNNKNDVILSNDAQKLLELQRAYISQIVRLLAELQKWGEPDFDGMLRNALNFLENDGRKVTY